MQEPELLEQINMATGVYEGVATMRVREALAASARIGRARASADGAARPADTAAAEVVRLLDRASDLYAQVCLRPCLPLNCFAFTSMHRRIHIPLSIDLIPPKKGWVALVEAAFDGIAPWQ